jgi:PhoH-like ATPase
MHQLLCDDFDLNILLGSAGTGKTLLAVASALELIIEKKKYAKLIVARTNDQMDKDIGFLPGTESEKVQYLLGGIIDSLEYLHKDDEDQESSLDYIINKANIEFRSVNYMRGRSISNAVIIYDEIQNATTQQIRGLLSRAGENSKVICLGNLKQIDNHFLNALSSGLTSMVERYKDYKGCSILHMTGVVRSKLAEFTESNL